MEAAGGGIADGVAELAGALGIEGGGGGDVPEGEVGTGFEEVADAGLDWVEGEDGFGGGAGDEGEEEP